MAATEQHLRGLLRAGAEEQREYRQQFILLKKKLLESKGANWRIRGEITDASDMVGLCKVFATDFYFKRILVRQLNITGDFDILKKIVRPSGGFVRPDDIFACGENKPELKESKHDWDAYLACLTPEEEAAEREKQRDKVYSEQLDKLKARLLESDLMSDMTKELIQDCNGMSQLCKLCFFAGNEDALLSELNKKKDFYLLVESFGSSKRTLSVDDIYNRGCRAKRSGLTPALHKFIHDKQFENFIFLLSSSRYSLDTQRKSDAVPYCKGMKEVCRLAFFKDPYDPYEPDSLTSVEYQLEQPGFDLLAAEVGGASTGFISAYAGPDSRKQSFKSFVEQLHRKAINPVEIFLTKSIRELEKYANNQSKPSFMDSSHAARRQFAQEKTDRLREMLDFCRSMNGTAEEINELQAVFIMPIVTESPSPLERAKEQFGRSSLRGLGAVLKQFEKNRQALCLSTSVAELLERGHEEGLQQVSSLQSGRSSFQTAEAVRPVMEEDTQRQPAAFAPFEVVGSHT
ncbi:hypothetical protein PsalMR5_03418 [Piscirickettsia salmonis]|uniref:hypothetical protein n=1 Tax=Piscirickettsia salmonis TaxID=1238 RepID=UPI001E33B7EF|nr:hypothetical protein [Piscirickettsia salmonis]QGP55943.1 hypothetical protein PsalSR1_03413 [Piscirickettsia salmonis]QGP58187.1 hypothetical protein PsalBI1_00741 [Piscirickettsia salmonis]QGP65512.1 hypothetical protein PsalMR5_03418 [Piscirickettsia salmonis]